MWTACREKAPGDAVTGPSTIIQAIAQGRQAASSIDKYLGGSGSLKQSGPECPPCSVMEAAPRGTPRQGLEVLPLNDRIDGFNLVEKGYGGPAAGMEAQRCLSCDMRDYNVTVNSAACKECGYCREVCSLGVFEVSGSFNPSGYKPMTASNSEKCIGCLRCLMICPDFAISIENKALT
ncbi:MAG: 4Fe-4S dicluster domain-containing protein [Bacillota bacterium]